MKTTLNYFRIWILVCTVVCASCSKEEVYEPLESDKLQSTKFRTSPYSLDIRVENKYMKYDYLYPNKTVVFKNQIWYITEKRSFKTPYTFVNQVWSSRDGKYFSLRSTDAIPMAFNRSLVAFNNKLWLIGGERTNDVWRSEDGIAWSRVSITPPFSNTSGSGVVVFNGKMFVFEKNSSGSQRVFSSTNGSFWHLENANAFPAIEQGRTIVYKNTLYYVGGRYNLTPNPTNDIYKSTNGRDWSKLNRGLTPFPDTTIFGPRSWFGMAILENKVWIIGGSTGGHTTPDNEIWYSSDMIRWTKYKGSVKFGWMTGHTAITFRDKIFLMGGFGEGEFFDAAEPLKEIWSIRTVRGLYP